MTRRQRALAARRALLVARCDGYRDELTLEFDTWQQRALATDRVLAVIYRYRILVALGVGFGAVMGLRHRSAWLRWLRRAWFAWGAWRSVRGASAVLGKL